MCKGFLPCAVIVLALAVQQAAGQDQPEPITLTLNITIDRVVAHTSSAVVFAHGAAELDAGSHLILLRNVSLPNSNQSLEEKSLQVNLEGAGALVERIVWDDVPLATKMELKALADEIEVVEANRSRVLEKIALSQGHLNTLQAFGGSLVRPSAELVLKGESILKILNDAHAAQVEVDENIHALRNMRKQLDSKLHDLHGNLMRVSQPQRVAKVYISVESKGTVTFHLQRIVASVAWRPHYEIHVNSTSGLVVMMYHALVHQGTGHAWTNISMELCTGAPSTDRKLPQLAPWFITSRSTASQPGLSQFERHRGQNMKLKKSASGEHFEKSRRSSALAHVEDDEEANDDDDMDYDGDHPFEEEADLGRSVRQSEVISSGVSDVFVLPKRQIIPSSQVIRVHIATINLKANLTYTAVPKRSTKVYVQALIINDSPFVLLAGSSLVFVDGSFLGSSNVDLIPTNGHAFIDIGIDNALSVLKRGISAESKSARDYVWSGKTMITELQYELVLKSMRSFGVTVHVKDQVPLPQSEDLKVVVRDPGIGELRADHKGIKIDANTTLRKGGEIVWERYLHPDTTLNIPLHFTISVDEGRYIHFDNHDLKNYEL